MTAFKATFALLFLFSFILAGCQSSATKKLGSNNQPLPSINESAIAAEYMEKENVLGKLMGTSKGPIDIWIELEDRPEGIVVIDLRSPADYAAGHIPGAVNISYTNLIEYYEKNNLQTRDFVILTSNSGQLARYVQGLMQMAGYNNVFFPKWGMSSWSPEIAKKTLANCHQQQIRRPVYAKAGTKKPDGRYAKDHNQQAYSSGNHPGAG